MKRFSIVVAVMCLCLLSLQAFAADMGASVDKLSAHEKSLWEAIKNNDLKAFAAGTADDLIDVDASGAIYNKKEFLDLFAKMKMTEYALSDFSTFALDKDCVVLIYKSASTAMMDGKSMTMKVINTTTYINQGGKWIPKFHSETVVPEAMK